MYVDLRPREKGEWPGWTLPVGLLVFVVLLAVVGYFVVGSPFD